MRKLELLARVDKFNHPHEGEKQKAHREFLERLDKALSLLKTDGPVSSVLAELKALAEVNDNG